MSGASIHYAGFRVPGSKPEAVIFDAGGTLVLIDPDRFNSFIAGWKLPAVEPGRLIDAHYRAMSDYADRLAGGEHLAFGWWVERFFGLAGLPIPADMAEAFHGGRGMWHHPVPGAMEAVQDLRARDYRVAVVSNSDGTVAEALNMAGFGGVFEVVVDSTDVGVSKPDPAIFAMALRRLGLPADQAWYVGDSHFHDLGGAKAAGLAASVLIDPLGRGPAGQMSVRAISELGDLLP